jgi:hypothetical protein
MAINVGADDKISTIISSATEVFLIGLLVGLSSCQSTLTKETTPKNSPSVTTKVANVAADTNKISPDTTTPLAKVMAITAKVHYRLRYYGEDIKTTLNPQKQQALFDNVRQTVRPACEQLRQLQASVPPTAISEVTTMLKLLNTLDQALANHDLDAIRRAVQRFYPAYQALQAKQAKIATIQ